MLQPVLLPTADENKRQYPIDFMLERRISHNPQASSPHVIHEQPTLSAQMGNNFQIQIRKRCVDQLIPFKEDNK
jgi:hypothetical protein